MSKKVFVFIDTANLWDVQKAKAKILDLEKIKQHLKSKHNADKIKVYYYDAYPEADSRDYDVSGKHKFYTYLKKGLKFVVRKKPLKRILTNSELGTIEEKGNMDVEMAIDMVNQIHNYDEAILFSGDSDFMALIKFIHSHQKKVFVYSSRNNISSELRTGGDGYIDILKISDDIWRGDLKHRGQ